MSSSQLSPPQLPLSQPIIQTNQVPLQQSKTKPVRERQAPPPTNKDINQIKSVKGNNNKTVPITSDNTTTTINKSSQLIEEMSRIPDQVESDNIELLKIFGLPESMLKSNMRTSNLITLIATNIGLTKLLNKFKQETKPLPSIDKQIDFLKNRFIDKPLESSSSTISSVPPPAKVNPEPSLSPTFSGSTKSNKKTVDNPIHIKMRIELTTILNNVIIEEKKISPQEIYAFVSRRHQQQVMEEKKFNNLIADYTPSDTQRKWADLLSISKHSNNSNNRRSHMETQLKSYTQSPSIYPLARNSKFEFPNTIHSALFLLNDGYFDENQNCYYILSNEDPIIDPETGTLNYAIRMVVRGEIICAEGISSTRSMKQGESNLVFRPNRDCSSFISDRFLVSIHSKLQTVEFLFNNSNDTNQSFILDFQYLRKITNPYFKVVNQEETTPNDLLVNIPLNNQNQMQDWYRFLNKNNARLVKPSHDSDINFLKVKTRELIKNVNDSFTLYQTDPTDLNLKIFEAAYVQKRVMMTFLLLFPSRKNSKLKQNGSMMPYLQARWVLYQEAVKQQSSSFVFNIHSLVNPPNLKSKPLGKAKQAEISIIKRQYQKCYDLLKSIDTLEPIHMSDATQFDKLQQLHPDDQRDLMDFNQYYLNSPIQEKMVKQISEENFQEYIKRTATKGVSPGLDCITGELIYQLIMDDDDQNSKDVLTECTKFINLLSNPKLPTFVWRDLTSASITGIPKNNDELKTNVRPIAIPLLWRKAHNACLLKVYVEEISAALGNVQYGIGKKHAMEKIGNNVRYWFADHKEKFILKFDLSNAFNTFFRSAAFMQMLTKIPDLAHRIIAIYNEPLLLYHKSNKEILAWVGSQQGCVLGPLLFCFAFNEVIEKLKIKYPNLIINAYMDDNVILFEGDKQDVINFIHDFINECKLIGLNINPSKSVIIIPIPSLSDNSDEEVEFGNFLVEKFKFKEQNILFRSVCEEENLGLNILGIPIGTDTYIKKSLLESIDQYLQLNELTNHIKNHHCRWSILSNSNFSRLTHIFRTIPSKYTKLIAETFRKSDFGVLNRILALEDLPHLTKEFIDQLKSSVELKLKHGGLGFPCYRILSHTAFIGSQCNILENLLEQAEIDQIPITNNCMVVNDIYESFLPLWYLAKENGLNTDPSPEDKIGSMKAFISSIMKGNIGRSNKTIKFQSTLSDAIYKDAYHSIISTCKQGFVGNHFIINPSLEETVDNKTYQYMMRFYLKTPFVNPDIQRLCLCSRHCKVDPQETHFRSCPNFNLIPIHDKVVKLMRTFFQSLGYRTYTGEILIQAFNNKPNDELLNGLSNYITQVRDSKNNNNNNNNNDLDEDDSMEDNNSNYSNKKNTNNDITNNSNSSFSNNIKVPDDNKDLHQNDIKISPIISKISTEGQHVDIWVADINLLADVTIVSPERIQIAENAKDRLHQHLAKEQGLDYMAPTFSNEGIPSFRTLEKLKTIYNQYLEKLSNSMRSKINRSGSSLSSILNKISFTINKYKAEQALGFLPRQTNNLFGGNSGKLSYEEYLDLARMKSSAQLRHAGA